MKNGSMVIKPEEIDCVFISSQLRIALELKLDQLFDEKVFAKYKDKKLSAFKDLNKGEHLHAYIFDSRRNNYFIKGKMLSGIKNWFNMLAQDRQFIIMKFKNLYYCSLPPNELVPGNALKIIFCKFLVNELLQTLSELRWQ